MGTKEAILSLFEEQKGTYLSGEEIAERLSVSRTAVWKAVKSLRNEGYEIDAVPNKGYSLSVHTDILSAQGIQKYLNAACHALELHVLPETGSTNTVLREKANAGAEEGCTVIAGVQTAGRGRMGRSFYSLGDIGVYTSILLRPKDLTPVQAIGLTTMAAVAVCEAIEEVSGRQAQIKWVNDVFMNGKKVSGILTEASMGLESGSLDYVIVGVGINVYAPKDGFPEEIEQIAGAVFQERQNDGKNHLAAEFLNHFMEYYEKRQNADYVEKYRERCFVIGKEIRVLSSGGERKALALDVDEECHLLVRYEDDSTERLSSGEISIRF